MRKAGSEVISEQLHGEWLGYMCAENVGVAGVTPKDRTGEPSLMRRSRTTAVLMGPRGDGPAEGASSPTLRSS